MLSVFHFLLFLFSWRLLNCIIKCIRLLVCWIWLKHFLFEMLFLLIWRLPFYCHCCWVQNVSISHWFFPIFSTKPLSVVVPFSGFVPACSSFVAAFSGFMTFTSSIITVVLLLTHVTFWATVLKSNYQSIGFIMWVVLYLTWYKLHTMPAWYLW